MPKDKAPETPDPARIRDARKFLERLRQTPVPKNHLVAPGVEVTTPVRKRKPRVRRQDPLAMAAIDQDEKAVRQDISAAMGKIRGTLLTLRTMRDRDREHPAYRPDERNDDMQFASHLLEGLHTDGRDKISYAPFIRKDKLDELLDAWDDSWLPEDTAAMLLDLSRPVRAARARRGDLPGLADGADAGKPGKLLSPTLAASRTETQEVNQRSDWYRDLPENTRTHAGASSSTALLLLMLEDLDVPLHQVEAILNGLVTFWERPLRRISGKYHTAAEVWAVYNEHLERRLRLQWEMNQREEEEGEEETEEEDEDDDPDGDV